MARAGDAQVACPLPRAGWFPDDDDPPPLPDDPADEAPTVDSRTPLDERVTVINAVLPSWRPSQPLATQLIRSRPEPLPVAGIRFRRRIDPFPVDLFPPLGRPYDEIADRIR